MRWPWQRRAPAPIVASSESADVVASSGAEPAMLSSPPATIAKASGSQPIGTDGVAIFGGQIVSYERDPNLLGVRKWRTFDNLVLNTAIVASATRIWCDLGASAKLRTEPNPRGGRKARKCADLVTEGLLEGQFSGSMRSVVRRQLLKKHRGFALHESMIRRRRDGRIVFADLQHRPQWTIYQWLRPDPRKPWTAVVQQTSTETSPPIPRARLIYSVEDLLTDAPDGVGLFRHLVELARVRDVYTRLEGVGYQTDLGGMPVGRAPIGKLQQEAAAALGAGASSDEISAWITARTKPLVDLLQAHNKRHDQWLMLDSAPYRSIDDKQTPAPVLEWAFDVVRSTMTAAPGIANAIMRLDREMARLMNAEWLLLGDGSGGTYNMHENKTAMFGLSINSCLDDVCDDLTRDGAARLAMLNGFDPETCAPKILHDPIETQDVESACRSLLMLSQAGLGPDDEAPDVMRGRMNLPPCPDVAPDAMLQRPTRLPRTPELRSSDKPGTDDGKPGNAAADPDQPGAEP